MYKKTGSIMNIWNAHGSYPGQKSVFSPSGEQPTPQKKEANLAKIPCKHGNRVLLAHKLWPSLESSYLWNAFSRMCPISLSLCGKETWKLNL